MIMSKCSKWHLLFMFFISNFTYICFLSCVCWTSQPSCDQHDIRLPLWCKWYCCCSGILCIVEWQSVTDFWDILLVPASRVKKSKKSASNTSVCSYKGNGVVGNQLPVCAVWNGRRVKISSCSPSFCHHDCTAQFMNLLIMLFFLRPPITCILLCGNVLSAVWYQMSSLGFFLKFIVVLLLCCMKYLNGKLEYLAPIIFYWYYCCNYFYCYNTVNNNCNSNAICSLKQHIFGLSRFLFVLYLVSLYLFITYLHGGLCMHMYCLVC